MLRPSQMIVLIDEVHHANHEDFNLLYEYYIMDRIKSLVFAGPDFGRVHFNKAFKSDTKVYKLNDMKKHQGREILEGRMPGQRLINASLADRVFQLSGCNPRTFLENMEDLLRRMNDLGKEKIVKKDIEEFFIRHYESMVKR